MFVTCQGQWGDNGVHFNIGSVHFNIGWNTITDIPCLATPTVMCLGRCHLTQRGCNKQLNLHSLSCSITSVAKLCTLYNHLELEHSKLDHISQALEQLLMMGEKLSLCLGRYTKHWLIQPYIDRAHSNHEVRQICCKIVMITHLPLLLTIISLPIWCSSVHSLLSWKEVTAGQTN